MSLSVYSRVSTRKEYSSEPVSYTHLDVYKRQVLDSEGRQQVIYKHAISTIAPARNVTLWEDAE